MKNIKNMAEVLYLNMDNESLRDIERKLYNIADKIQEYRFTKEGRIIDHELITLLRLMGVDIYNKTYEELKHHILKIKNIIEFIELL